jgi:hypothetical protein
MVTGPINSSEGPKAARGHEFRKPAKMHAGDWMLGPGSDAADLQGAGSEARPARECSFSLVSQNANHGVNLMQPIEPPGRHLIG